MKKTKTVFLNGPISTDFIAQAIAKHQHKTDIGAHQIFLGQVRADTIKGKKVEAIDYTAYKEMAQHVLDTIKEKTFQRYKLTCLHIYHSLNVVPAGQICLFVFVSSSHRDQTAKALSFLVEEIKKRAPIFGKEIFNNQSHQWKTNTSIK